MDWSKQIGALWKKKSQYGEFTSGKINREKLPAGTDDISIVVYENGKKREGKNDPDYNIFINDWKKPQS